MQKRGMINLASIKEFNLTGADALEAADDVAIGFAKFDHGDLPFFIRFLFFLRYL